LRRAEDAQGTPWKTAKDGTLERRKPQKRPEDTSSSDEGDEEASNALQRFAAQAPKLTRWQPPGAQGEETKEAAKDALNFWAFPLEVRGSAPRLE